MIDGGELTRSQVCRSNDEILDTRSAAVRVAPLAGTSGGESVKEESSLTEQCGKSSRKTRCANAKRTPPMLHPHLVNDQFLQVMTLVGLPDAAGCYLPVFTNCMH